MHKRESALCVGLIFLVGVGIGALVSRKLIFEPTSKDETNTPQSLFESGEQQQNDTALSLACVNNSLWYGGAGATASGSAMIPERNYTAGDVIWLFSVRHWDAVPWWQWTPTTPSYFTTNAGGLQVGYTGAYWITASVFGCKSVSDHPNSKFGFGVFKLLVPNMLTDVLFNAVLSDQPNVLVNGHVSFTANLDAGDILVLAFTSAHHEEEEDGQVIINCPRMTNSNGVYSGLTPDIAMLTLIRRYP
jgi:hypothetical protein